MSKWRICEGETRCVQREEHHNSRWDVLKFCSNFQTRILRYLQDLETFRNSSEFLLKVFFYWGMTGFGTLHKWTKISCQKKTIDTFVTIWSHHWIKYLAMLYLVIVHTTCLSTNFPMKTKSKWVIPLTCSALELILYHWFNNNKLSFFASHM